MLIMKIDKILCLKSAIVFTVVYFIVSGVLLILNLMIVNLFLFPGNYIINSISFVKQIDEGMLLLYIIGINLAFYFFCGLIFGVLLSYLKKRL